MAVRKAKAKRDLEKSYPMKSFVAKLRRLADCLDRCWIRNSRQHRRCPSVILGIMEAQRLFVSH
jgi:hypothetical protein